MKHDLLVLLLLLFGSSAVIAQNSEEEEGKENKAMLLKMVEERSFSSSGTHPINDYQETAKGRNVTGFQETIASMVQIFPNPANEMVYVRSEKTLYDNLIITDVLERLVTIVKPTVQLTAIDVSNWAKGAYFIDTNEVVFKVEKV